MNKGIKLTNSHKKTSDGDAKALTDATLTIMYIKFKDGVFSAETLLP